MTYRMWSILLSVLLGLALLVATGCGGKTSAKKTGSAGHAERTAMIELEYEQVDLAPGTQRRVKVLTGKAETAEVAKESGLTAKIEEDTVAVAATKTAKKGKHIVRVKGDKSRDAVFAVNVRR